MLQLIELTKWLLFFSLGKIVKNNSEEELDIKLQQ